MGVDAVKICGLQALSTVNTRLSTVLYGLLTRQWSANGCYGDWHCLQHRSRWTELGLFEVRRSGLWQTQWISCFGQHVSVSVHFASTSMRPLPADLPAW